tara:strand:+ start:9652 stop:9882 length:231 start_codon:yes stop_codon:yes gene_type:complete
MEIKYLIYEKSQVDQINFEKIIETNLETLRSSNNNEKVIVKFVGETPSFLEGLNQYTHSEIIEILYDPENGWITNE